jgi:membrane-associated phospholipid phosphatase
MPSSHMTVIIALFLSKMNASSSSKYEKIIWLVITILEGLSRVILNYHTVGQVIGGTIFGIVYTMIFN